MVTFVKILTSIRSASFFLLPVLIAGLPQAQGRPLVGEEFFRLPRGVVIDEVGSGSALEKAGLLPGDTLYSWKRVPDVPRDHSPASGSFDSPFDWSVLRVEQAPRGSIEIHGMRYGVATQWKIENGDWTGEVRPRWPDELQRPFLQGKQQLENGNRDGGIDLWRELARNLDSNRYVMEKIWVFFKITEAWAKAEQWGEVQSSLEPWNQPSKLGSLQGMIFNHLGTLAWEQGRTSTASAYFSKAFEILPAQAPGSLSLARLNNNLGTVAFQRRETRVAEQRFQESLSILEEELPGWEINVGPREAVDLPNYLKTMWG